VVSATAEVVSQAPHRASHPKSWDLEHVQLVITPDPASKSISGTAQLRLTPYFYSQLQLQLDAKDMEIHRVRANNENLVHTYDGKHITISLPQAIEKGDQLLVTIQYTAHPYASDSIAADAHGFFFVDDDTDWGQVWTQGETEYNSRWFPSIDKPNERCTQDIYVRVPEGIQCLSNGDFVGTKNVDGGLVEYNYRMDQPHAPYLFLVAAGKFGIEEEMWNDVELAYWVDPAYQDYASEIFRHTPEMLTFFSEIYGYDFPWPSYRQIVIKEFVSGAMENTTAVTFGEFVQKVPGELIDDHNDDIVAHEMAHHWFGDLATCESWANLTLNEGFANYAEYLWREHKYGVEEAEAHRRREYAGYMSEYYSGRSHPLIYYRYDDKEEMFDAHSYNKGGLVLHMLRKMLGDEAFFASLSYYLNQHAYQSVEVEDLRLAFEHITGLDLRIYFDQWYLTEGHPVIETEITYADGNFSIGFRQNTKTVYTLPIEIWLESRAGKFTRHTVLLTKDRQSFDFSDVASDTRVWIDPQRTLLAEWQGEQSGTTVVSMIGLASDRYQADLPLWTRTDVAEELLGQEGVALSEITKLISDTHSEIKQMALVYADEFSLSVAPEKLKSLAMTDDNSIVRSLAVYQLGGVLGKDFLMERISSDSSYEVLHSALISLAETSPEDARKQADAYVKLPGTALKLSAAGVYAAEGRATDEQFFQTLADDLSSQDYLDFSGIYADYLIAAGPQLQQRLSPTLLDQGTNDADLYRRLGAGIIVYSLYRSSGDESYGAMFKQISTAEKHPALRGVYEGFE